MGSAGVPSPRLWKAADEARGRGQRLTLCTARLAAGPTREWAEALDASGWHVFHTGAARWNPDSGEVRTVPLADEARRACIETGTSRGWVVEVYSWDDYAVDHDGRLAVEHAGLLDLPFRRRSLDSVADEDVVRVQYVVTEADAAEAIASAPAGTVASGATSPIMPGAVFVSITDASVSKAAGVLAVAADLGVDPAVVMMVGDGHNDLSAMGAVGWGVAMGNADPEVKEAARLMVADVDDDGAAEAIERSVDLT